MRCTSLTKCKALSNTFVGHQFKEMEFCSFLPDFDQAFHIQFIWLNKRENLKPAMEKKKRKVNPYQKKVEDHIYKSYRILMYREIKSCVTEKKNLDLWEQLALPPITSICSPVCDHSNTPSWKSGIMCEAYFHSRSQKGPTSSGFVMGQKIRPHPFIRGSTTPGLTEWDKKGSPD